MKKVNIARDPLPQSLVCFAMTDWKALRKDPLSIYRIGTIYQVRICAFPLKDGLIKYRSTWKHFKVEKKAYWRRLVCQTNLFLEDEL